jgi:hypothetical protein
MKKFFAALALIPSLALAASTWTIDTSLGDARVYISKVVTTTGSESAPPNPAKAGEGVTLANVADGNTFVVTGAGKTTTLTASSAFNTDVYFDISGNDDADATNLAAAINRAGLAVSAAAVAAKVTVTARDFGAESNAIALNYTGLGGVWTCDNACLLVGGVGYSGLDLFGLKGFAIHAQTAGGAAMTAGGKLKAYIYNPFLGRYAETPDLDLTVAALPYQGFTGFTVPADWGYIAYVPSGTGQAGSIFLVGRR